MQKSGDFVVLAGLNAENEILHTLAFLAGVMFWSQVGLDFSFHSKTNFFLHADMTLGQINCFQMIEFYVRKYY